MVGFIFYGSTVVAFQLRGEDSAHEYLLTPYGVNVCGFQPFVLSPLNVEKDEIKVEDGYLDLEDGQIQLVNCADYNAQFGDALEEDECKFRLTFI